MSPTHREETRAVSPTSLGPTTSAKSEVEAQEKTTEVAMVLRSKELDVSADNVKEGMVGR